MNDGSRRGRSLYLNHNPTVTDESTERRSRAGLGRAPMIRIHLPRAEVEALERVLRTESDPRLRTRVQIVLMAHRGRPPGQIAADTGTRAPRSSGGSTPTWIAASTDCRPVRPGRAAAQTDRRPGPGPPPVGHRGAAPRGWTGPTGRTRSWPTTCTTRGIRVRKSACRRSAARRLRPYRPTYRYLRGDPEKQARPGRIWPR